MGNSNSGRPRKKPTDPRIQALGEKFPFGDAELIQLVQCHETCVESSSSKSFLSRLASACASPERRDGTEIIIVLMEQHILPPGFSELLCKSIFGLDYEDYLGTRKKTSVSGGNGNSDLLLDAFLEGMGSCLGRRGDRSSLFTLLRCSSSESPDDILDLAYRLALAVECWISCRDPEEGVTTETIVKSFIPQGKLTEMSQSLLTACEEMNNQNHSFSTDFLSPTHSTSKRQKLSED